MQNKREKSSNGCLRFKTLRERLNGLVWSDSCMYVFEYNFNFFRCSIHPAIFYATGIGIFLNKTKPKKGEKFKCNNCFKSKKFAHFTN